MKWLVLGENILLLLPLCHSFALFQHFLKLMVNPEFSSRNETSKVHRVHRIWPKHLTTPKELAIAQKMSSNSDSFSGQHFNTFHFMDAGFSQLQNVVVDSCRGS
jgi:hypothetical protein